MKSINEILVQLLDHVKVLTASNTNVREAVQEMQKETAKMTDVYRLAIDKFAAKLKESAAILKEFQANPPQADLTASSKAVISKLTDHVFRENEELTNQVNVLTDKLAKESKTKLMYIWMFYALAAVVITSVVILIIGVQS